MKVNDLKKVLNYNEIFCADADAEITGAYTSDLLSDVMGNAKEDSALITIQSHKNTVAVATLASICVIIICSNREIPEDMIEAAKAEDISIYLTEKNQFQVSCEVGKLLGF